MLNFDWLAAVPPEGAKWVFLVLFIVIALLVWRIPDAYIYAGLTDRRWWHNLKGWATAVLALIFVTYYLF